MMSATATLTRCPSDDEQESAKDQQRNFELKFNQRHHHHPQILGYSCICNQRVNPNCYCYGNKAIYHEPYHQIINCTDDINKTDNHFNVNKTKSKVKLIKKKRSPKYRCLSKPSSSSTSNVCLGVHCQTDQTHQQHKSHKSEMITIENTNVDINSRLQDLEDLLTKFDNDKPIDNNNNQGDKLITNEVNQNKLETVDCDENQTPELSKINNLDDGDDDDDDNNKAIELHKSKSYIVNLIDKALTKELGTIPENQFTKQDKLTNMTPKQAIETINRHSIDKVNSFGKYNRFVSADFLKQLQQIRRKHLKNIQKETKKLAELEHLVEMIDGLNNMFV